MSTELKLYNANGKVTTIENPDTETEDVTISTSVFKYFNDNQSQNDNKLNEYVKLDGVEITGQTNYAVHME